MPSPGCPLEYSHSRGTPCRDVRGGYSSQRITPQNAPQDSIPLEEASPGRFSPRRMPTPWKPPLLQNIPFPRDCPPKGSPPRGMSLLEEVYPPPWRMSLEEAHRRVSLHKAEPRRIHPGRCPPQKMSPGYSLQVEAGAAVSSEAPLDGSLLP